nr:MAG TPA: hypothetical protein [Caudoviricetes sp.]
MKKITKKELYNTLENFKGKKQYLFATFKGDINYFIDTLEDADLTSCEEHISNTSRIIKDFKVLSNGFKINDSSYYFSGKTNIYKIDIYGYVYIILHNVDTNSIVIYEHSVA